MEICKYESELELDGILGDLLECKQVVVNSSIMFSGGISRIFSIRQLESICLNGLDIGNDGARCVGELIVLNSSLSRIMLARNKIGDEGAQWISNGLAVNSSLQTIDLSKNRITDKGADFIGDALKSNISLQKINLSNNGIRLNCEKKIFRLLEQCKQRRISQLRFSKFAFTHMLNNLKIFHAPEKFQLEETIFRLLGIPDKQTQTVQF
jgi:Ran GTPase-activating protein (RanGAP) involved in mRNA processing and transport